MSFLKTFTVPPETPILIGGIGQGGPVDAFVARFGTTWKKTPIKGVFFIGVSGCQFTLRDDDVAWYDFATIEEFKEVFSNRPAELAGNANYFTLDPTMKYSGLSVMKYMADNEIA